VRTTVTLDPDVEALVKRQMRERGVTFKQAVNDAIRGGTTRRSSTVDSSFPTYNLGEPTGDVTKALRLADELENQELSAKITRGA